MTEPGFFTDPGVPPAADLLRQQVSEVTERAARPPLRDMWRLVDPPQPGQIVSVVMYGEHARNYEDWLINNGLHLIEIPEEDREYLRLTRVFGVGVQGLDLTADDTYDRHNNERQRAHDLIDTAE